MPLTIAPTGVLRIVLVDDQALLRAGMRAMLSTDPALEVVGEAGDGASGVGLVLERHPDIVLMDLTLPGVDGIEATRRIVAGRSRSRVLVLTDSDDDAVQLRAVAAGAAGCLAADTAPEQLLAAVHRAAAGEPVLSPAVVQRLVETQVHGAVRETALRRRFEDLTAREGQILERVARGLSNAAISAELFLSEATVKTHVTRILAKLGVASRVQAVVLAYEGGFVRLGDAFDAEPEVCLRVAG